MSPTSKSFPGSPRHWITTSPLLGYLLHSVVPDFPPPPQHPHATSLLPFQIVLEALQDASVKSSAPHTGTCSLAWCMSMRCAEAIRSTDLMARTLSWGVSGVSSTQDRLGRDPEQIFTRCLLFLWKPKMHPLLHEAWKPFHFDFIPSPSALLSLTPFMTNDIWLLSKAVNNVDRRGFQLQVFESPALEATFPLLSFWGLFSFLLPAN